MRYLGGLVVLVLLGCNRNDTEALARIGRTLAGHARSNVDNLGARLDLRGLGKREPTLQDKIQDRLRFENTLAELTLEVQVNDKEVELKGTVKSDLQRQRAAELAETVAGVEKVTNSLQVMDTP